MPVEIITVPCRSDNYAYLIRDQVRPARWRWSMRPPSTPSSRRWRRAAGASTRSGSPTTTATTPRGRGAARPLRRAKVVGHAADSARLPALDLALSEGETVSLGDTVARVIDVSGHTIGHIAFVIDAEKAAFTADSLMALGCGRVFEGTHAMMWGSLSKFLAMPDDMQIYSGHNYGQANGRFALSIEPDNAALQARIARIKAADAAGEVIVPASLAEERATNPFLRATEAAVKALVGLAGADDAAVFAEVRRRKDAF